MRCFDRVIIGAGLYGLYAAYKSAASGHSVLVIEHDASPFSRATFANQARVHQGYHYPRSLFTAEKTARYFHRFIEDFGFCINASFEQIYGVSSSMSWSDAGQFLEFCSAAGIPCNEVNPSQFFKEGKCDGAFRTQEYTYDAVMLRDYLVEKIIDTGRGTFYFNTKPEKISEARERVIVTLNNNREEVETEYLLNSSYASINQILDLVGYEKFPIKYELCEIALCTPNQELSPYGFTVMDGPFFSIMPFGFSNYHSLTSVAFTPHEVSFDELPAFSCQACVPGYCSSGDLGNCNDCAARPATAFPYMERLAKKYIKEDYSFAHERSLYSVKPILKAAEIDDSRPTLVEVHSVEPLVASVLSGKISTIYDMDEVLDYE